MTNEEFDEILERTNAVVCSREWYERAIKVLEQEPSEDAVSRQAIDQNIYDYAELGHDSENEMVIEDIQSFPSVTPATCIAKVTFDKDDLQELVDKKVKELTQHIERKWIPCSERLPKPGEYVDDVVAKYYLVQNEYGDMLVARYTHSEYWEQIYRMEPIDDEVVAWMPLPKQYKAEMESNVCKDCYYNDGEVHAECVVCDKAESEE